ncbi:hypothetical protein [Frigoribacterium sp. SL97]|uniref:hypothetical protein n=1 Tax=Frigoribacterium sp. SL97 TaxID=2994664 RepID=UPI00226E5ECE|nr:hypothetical protein [Frigoribacterium sp. SL97]WAC50263.1 hypothetical protein OVA02_10210 [Frigoribacterium sp. SL97]
MNHRARQLVRMEAQRVAREAKKQAAERAAVEAEVARRDRLARAEAARVAQERAAQETHDAAVAALSARLTRLVRRAAFVTALAVSVLIALGGAVIPQLLSTTDAPRSEPFSVSVTPKNPTGYSAGAVGTQVFMTVEERRSFAQQLGAKRTPRIIIEAEFSLPAGRDVSEEYLSWQVNVSKRFLGLRYQVGLDADGRKELAEWTFQPTDRSDGPVAPFDITPFVQETPGSDRVYVSFYLELDIDAPVTSQIRHDGDWQQVWTVGWSSEGVEAPRWVTVDSKDMKNYTPEDGVTTYIPPVQVSVCPSCSIVSAYGEIEETSPDKFITVGDMTKDQELTLTTDWRPFGFLGRAWVWLLLFVLGLLATAALSGPSGWMRTGIDRLSSRLVRSR